MPSEHARHILDEIDFLIEASAPLCRESFLGDQTLRRAFVRSLEVIGEAAARLPADGETGTGRRAALAIRHQVLHDYFGVDYALVWDVVVRKVPDLRPRIQALVGARDNAAHSRSNR